MCRLYGCRSFSYSVGHVSVGHFGVYIVRCGEITKNDFESSIFDGKPVYIYTKVSPFIDF